MVLARRADEVWPPGPKRRGGASQSEAPCNGAQGPSGGGEAAAPVPKAASSSQVWNPPRKGSSEPWPRTSKQERQHLTSSSSLHPKQREEMWYAARRSPLSPSSGISARTLRRVGHASQRREVRAPQGLQKPVPAQARGKLAATKALRAARQPTLTRRSASVSSGNEREGPDTLTSTGAWVRAGRADVASAAVQLRNGTPR